MAKQVDFYFDFGSPNAYLAYTQMPGLAERSGAEVIYKPMLLGGLFKAVENVSPAFHPLKGAYLQIDLPRCAKRWGVPFALNPHFPVTTLAVLRGAVAMQLDGGFTEYADTVYRAMWVEQKKMDDPAVIAEVLGAIGIDAEAFAARIREDEVKKTLIATTEEAASRGIFGAPTFFVDGEMFFGQDRIDFVEAALA